MLFMYIQYCAECKGASDQISTSFCESRTAWRQKINPQNSQGKSLGCLGQPTCAN